MPTANRLRISGAARWDRTHSLRPAEPFANSSFLANAHSLLACGKSRETGIAIGNSANGSSPKIRCRFRTVANVRLTRQSRLILSWRISGFPQTSNAAGGHNGGHCHHGASEFEYNSINYAGFWLPFTAPVFQTGAGALCHRSRSIADMSSWCAQLMNQRFMQRSQVSSGVSGSSARTRAARSIASSIRP